MATTPTRTFEYQTPNVNPWARARDERTNLAGGTPEASAADFTNDAAYWKGSGGDKNSTHPGTDVPDYSAWVGVKNQWGRNQLPSNQLGYTQYLEQSGAGSANPALLEGRTDRDASWKAPASMTSLTGTPAGSAPPSAFAGAPQINASGTAPASPAMDSLMGTEPVKPPPTLAGDHTETQVPASAGSPPSPPSTTGPAPSAPAAPQAAGTSPKPPITGYRDPNAPAATTPGQLPGHTDPYTEQPGTTEGETRGTSWGGHETWNGSEWLPSGGGGAAAPTAPGGPAPTGTPALDPQAAKEAAFARAKDKIGSDTRASMTALRESLAGRGALGGGVEQGGMASLIGGGAGNLSDVVSNQAAFDVAGNNAMADRNYAGALTQRGQNLGTAQSLLSLLGGAY